MRGMQRDFQATFVFCSHDPQVLAAADDAVVLQDGRIVRVERQADADLPEAQVAS
jgi:putative ABC transport system ATP-binding protein